MAWPAPPDAECVPIRCSTRSFAVTPVPGRPVKRTRICAGFTPRSVSVASACSQSLEPMPQPSAPSAPRVQVWLSGQATIRPGSVIACSAEMRCEIPCRGSSMSNKVIEASFAARRMVRINASPPGTRVLSVRPGKVSTIWSIVANTCRGLRTRRPSAARLVSATLPVRSCRNRRSTYRSDEPSSR